MIIRLIKSRVGLALLLALLSYFVLSILWQLTATGSLGFRLIAAIFRPSYATAHYLAFISYGDDHQHASATSLIDLVCFLITYTIFWYAVLIAFRWKRAKKN